MSETRRIGFTFIAIGIDRFYPLNPAFRAYPIPGLFSYGFRIPPWRLGIILLLALTGAAFAAGREEGCRRDPADEETVARVYRDVLGREPDECGLETYLAHLGEGRNEAWLRRVLRRSEEGRRRIALRRRTLWARAGFAGAALTVLALMLALPVARLSWLPGTAAVIALLAQTTVWRPCGEWPAEVRHWRVSGPLSEALAAEPQAGMLRVFMNAWHTIDPFAGLCRSLYDGRHIELPADLFGENIRARLDSPCVTVVGKSARLTADGDDGFRAYAQVWYNPLLFSPVDYGVATIEERKVKYRVVRRREVPPLGTDYPLALRFVKPPRGDDGDIVTVRSGNILYFVTRRQRDERMQGDD